MLIEVLKLFAAIVGGGLAGAFVNEFWRRRNSRLQTIPLIERLNRVVDPKIGGITLARVTTTSGTGEQTLTELRNLREYQFTLKNTSSVHLQNVEIQFEFPAEDVEAWAERPALSRTTPVALDTAVSAELDIGDFAGIFLTSPRRIR